MTQPAIHLDALRALIDPNQLAEREGKPVATPGSTEEVAAITRHAHANRLAIEIVGAGTKRGWGNPVAADVLLDTTRLAGVRQHSWHDLTATVAAGTPWASMQRVLAEHNQFVALDPLWPETATVGGIVATNDSGPLRLRYGSLRDLIIGMTIVLADGTIAHSGGKVVKNVAGYDLHKLITGAYGTLGIIAEVTFRLHPLPKHRQTFTVSAPQAQQLTPLMAAIRDSHLLTEAMQLRGDSYGFHLDVQLNAHPDARQSDILRKMAEAAGLEPSQPHAPASPIARQRDDGGSSGLQAAESAPTTDPGFSPGPFTDVWKARENLFREENRIALKTTMSPADVCHFAAVLSSYGGNSVTQAYGIMTAALYGIMDVAFHSLREEFEAKGGSVSLLQQYEGIPSFGAAQEPIPLMREIKHQFDPNRILNPGRFLGGI